MTIGDIASMIIALATTGSLLYISRQVNVTRQQTKGQFLLALDAQFEKFNDLTIRLVNEEDFTPVGNDWPAIFGLMSVFERINIMVEDNILDIGLVDRLYGFRMITLIANDGIYQRLASTGQNGKISLICVMPLLIIVTKVQIQQPRLLLSVFPSLVNSHGMTKTLSSFSNYRRP